MHKNCLIVVDMQEDFINPQGKLYVEGAENIVENIGQAITSMK